MADAPPPSKMIEQIFSSPSYDGAKRLLDVSVMRQEALASNIANIETPGFKRVELSKDFTKVFNEALKKGKAADVALPQVVQDLDSPSQRKDGNNVVLQDELMALNKNSAEYETLTDFVSGSVRLLRSAIIGKAQA